MYLNKNKGEKLKEYKKPRKYRCYHCGVVDENWNCAPWSKSDSPRHYTCGKYFKYSEKLGYDKMFLDSIEETN